MNEAPSPIRSASVPPFRRPFSPPRFARECRAIEGLVADAFRVPAAELFARTRRSAAVASARQAAMYLARVALQLSYGDIAAAFGRDPRTVAHACRVVEERREQPAFDAMLSRLERACAAMIAATTRDAS